MESAQHLAFGIEVELLIRPNQTVLPLILQKGWKGEMFNRKKHIWAPLDREMAILQRDRQRNQSRIRTLQGPLMDAEVIVRLARRILHTQLVELMRGRGLAANLNTRSYQEWTVKDERAIDEVDDFWRIEIISRVMTTNETWQTEIVKLFDVLSANFDILISTGCSMHVHVSPGVGRHAYTIAQLACMLKAVAFYDQAITKIMPAERKNNSWAQCNPLAKKTATELKVLFQDVPARGWGPLFDKYDAMIDGTPGNIHRNVHGDSRYMSWNFENVTKPCGTIEFRRPPGVASATEAIHWTGFALSFVAQALSANWSHPSLAKMKTYEGVFQLSEALKWGEGLLHPLSRNAIQQAWMTEDKRPPVLPNIEQEINIEMKKRAKNEEASPFAEKINSPKSSPVSSRTNSTDSQASEASWVSQASQASRASQASQASQAPMAEKKKKSKKWGW